MASNALFGSSAAGASRGVKNLVEFKAGKMTLKDKMVQPDKRKGLVYVYQSEDSLMHFCWKDRTTGIVEDDLMIFPDDIETKRVAQCTTGRVFLMKFKSSNKKFFFWMQETETDKDEKLWRKVNDYLNNPPPVGSNASSASGAGERGGVSSAAAGLANAFGGDFGGLGGSDLQSLLGSMSEQQLQMFLGGLMPVNSPSSNRSGSSSLSSNQTSRVQSTVPGSRAEPSSFGTAETPVKAEPITPSQATETETKEEPTTQDQKIQLSDLQNILGNLNAPGTTAGTRQDLDLSEVVTLEVMAPILADKNIQEKLCQYLPDSDILPKNEQELRNTLTTPQFKKAMSSFSSALQSGQLGPLMKQFDLPEQVMIAAAQGNIIEFSKAMEKFAQSKKGEKKTSETEDMMDTK